MAFNKKTVAKVREHVASAREKMGERREPGTTTGPAFAFGARFVRDSRATGSPDAAGALMGALDRWLAQLPRDVVELNAIVAIRT
jgi:hypothetical protein